MKLLFITSLSIVLAIYFLFTSYFFVNYLKDVEELKADYSMLYSEIEQLKSRIESMYSN